MTPIILASTSKYRRQLLARLQLPFETADPGVDETSFLQRGFIPRELAERLAWEKCFAVQARYPDALVIGSDQVAALGEQVLGKPGTEARAVAQLKGLNGKTHELFTAMAMAHGENRVLHTDVTRLRMLPHSDEALERYVAADRPLDCAGSYKIESLGIALFSEISTQDFSAIEGLPLLALSQQLRRFGISVP